MASSNKNKHLDLEERKIIERGIENNSTHTAIARTLGKDKSTIGKEIKAHRQKSYTCNMPLECSNYKKCVHDRQCTKNCPEYNPFKCNKRDRSPGACNGCDKYKSCRFTKYKYVADLADKEYREVLSGSREGINFSEEELIRIGTVIETLIKRGLSPYAILQAHPEIDMSERTMYDFIENGTFKNAGINLCSLDLRSVVNRRPMKRKDQNKYKERNDRKYLKGRTYKDFQELIEMNPNASIVQMDTVYNDVTNGPFMQTFKFMSYSFLVIIYHEKKTAQAMYEGILLLEQILGEELFNQEVQVILTDRGSEFTMADAIETREDGTRRTRIYYCDPMCSHQKGSLENNHEEIRYICPKETDLYALGLTSQEKANLIASHINSYPKEKLKGHCAFSYLEFLNPVLADRFKKFGIVKIDDDKLILKPYLLK